MLWTRRTDRSKYGGIRFASLTVFVPFQAKRAATLLCLAGDELALGSLGELGPLDQQVDEKQKADSP
jgi:hypothetical protein